MNRLTRVRILTVRAKVKPVPRPQEQFGLAGGVFPDLRPYRGQLDSGVDSNDSMSYSIDS